MSPQISAVALQCNRSRRYLIMDDNNFRARACSSPLFLGGPGVAIYTDARARRVEVPQPVFSLPGRVAARQRARLVAPSTKSCAPADKRALNLTYIPGPSVFEGNAPACASRKNDPFPPSLFDHVPHGASVLDPAPGSARPNFP